MRFICLGYADPEVFSSMSKEEMEANMEMCFAYDDELRRGGHFAGGEALQEERRRVEGAVEAHSVIVSQMAPARSPLLPGSPPGPPIPSRPPSRAPRAPPPPPEIVPPRPGRPLTPVKSRIVP